MANIKIAQLTNKTSLADTDLVIVESATQTMKMTVGKFKERLGIQAGGIVESGENANGRYIKYSDGTMICRGVFSEIIGCTTAMNYGGGYRSSSVIKEFPQPFTGRPVVTCSLEEYGSNNSISVMVAPLPSDFLTKCFAQWRTITSDGSRSRSAGYIAVGRWN